MKLFIHLAVLIVLSNGAALADQVVRSPLVNKAPNIDGLADDPAWKNAPMIITRDKVAEIDIELRTVHSDESLFFLVRFPDATEDRRHKTLKWNNSLQAYRSGFEREDSFVFKWNMEPRPVDLTISSEDSYKADIWYWKSFRTDRAGYADDKYHLYGPTKHPKSRAVYTRSGKPVFLTRIGDDGQSTYKSQTHAKFVSQRVDRYVSRQPSGSRADVRAKGLWKNGFWTIEFSRPFKTGHSDDVQFDRSLTYTFGVSRFEIAGKLPNSKLSQPLYESGEIGEHITLKWN